MDEGHGVTQRQEPEEDKTLAAGEVQEREATDVASVWGAPLTAVHCAVCREAHLVPAEDIPSRCPFCLQGPVTPQPAYLREEPPEQVVPYAVDKGKLATILDRWTQGIWFRPDELKASLLVQRAQRYLIPLWLVDGRVEGAWRADVGFDYQAVSYQDRYSDGMGWRSQEVREDRVRWEPRVGRLNRVYENVAAPALDDHRKLTKRVGDFDLSQRAGYVPDAVADAAVRLPTLEPEDAWDGAQAAFVRAAGADCHQAAGADHVRDFRLEATYGDLNWTLLLLPAYVAWYREGEQIWPILINGQTGRVSGARRGSARKANTTSLVLGGVAAILFLLGGLLSLVGAVFPPAVAVGGVILVLGLLLGMVAPIPAISVWVSNRRSTPQDYI
jgi:hypothetical protein